tara:strand:+ start:8924 stop:9214 length:291 start_codon:yes stop_codon:yes gene_type:complete
VEVMGFKITINSIEIMGFIAGVIVLISYLLVSRGKIKGDGAIYNFLVLIYCTLYLIYSIMISALAVFLLDVMCIIFALIALRKCYRVYQEKRKLKT